MRPFAAFLLAALAALAPAAAWAADAPVGFTGTLEMKLSSDRGPIGTMTMSMGKAGMLNEMQSTMPAAAGGAAMKMKSLVRFDHPGTVYLINDAQKTYAEMTTPGAGAADANHDEWTVQKLGTEKVAGYNCVHVKATSSKGMVVEMWTTQDLGDNKQFMQAMGNDSPMSGGLLRALQKEGAVGFPVKTVSASKSGSSTTMELVKATKATLPATLFDLPAGYTKSSMGGAAALPPEVQQQLQERMKQMTPAQQEAMKKAMGGGSPTP